MIYFIEFWNYVYENSETILSSLVIIFVLTYIITKDIKQGRENGED